ncbi:MAG: hypothetical protein AUI50_08190 [Crenarchaeota archaeon 13_1_40CM_2_52_14]|nr:MAG: hypothetical protein AUI97_05630 [Crenarchaeota archaeon 13_1_40CM_3_52_17]OLD34013.1 MAG: hypothetical protein AUI50_08190 [Crenarchaeota archaeon 13_1_40CM_2_52_14]OLE69526.1 MAG: hypothetical protein AUF78_10710 [archaeon 13_1_20CM_2_51_12]
MPISKDSPASPDIAPKTQIIDRIEREAGVPDLANILTNRLAPTDLQSLLLEVYGQRAKRREPRALLEDQVSNRFIRPSTTSPARLLDWDRVAFSRLPKVFQPIELSPVCPLGTVSALSPISQDWTVSTIRNTEVVSDSTNVLALECATRRREQKDFSSGKAASVHLAASHRLLRGQKFGVGPGTRQHFRVFTLCSAGRDSGNLRFETQTVSLHIGFYLAALRGFLGTRTALRVAISDFGSNEARPAVRSEVVEKFQSAHKKVRIGIDQDRKQGRGYYRQLCFKIYATPSNDREQELVDGGDVNWTQKLLNNAKERLIISGCGSERLCELFEPTASPKSTKRP